MSVIAIDFGTQNCYIGAANRGGVDVILNDYSHRQTPSCISFQEQNRLAGTAARSALLSNFKNTVLNFKRLIGRPHNDPQVQKELAEGFIPCRTVPVEDTDGGVGFELMYLNEEQTFSVEQVTAAMFTKLRQIAHASLGIDVGYCVICVPLSFTDVERRRVLDAARIAGLPVVCLMHETTAAALAYAMPRTNELPKLEEPPRRVLFFDCGYASTQAVAVEINNGRLRVVGSGADTQCGGRNFDERLRNNFAADFKEKYKMDVRSNRRAWQRLLDECERIKKQMSMNNNELPFSIECFMEDRDVKSRMNREDFEKLIAHDLDNIARVLADTMTHAGWKPDDIHSVEVFGGSTRVPAVKAVVERVTKKVAGLGLNADEAVAKGGALYCAMLSPTFRTQDWEILDLVPYPIDFHFALGDTGTSPISAATNKQRPVALLEGSENYPITRQVTLALNQSFRCELIYNAQKAPIPHSQHSVGQFSVNYDKKALQAAAGDQNKTDVRVKFKVDRSAIINLSGAAVKQEVLADAKPADSGTINEGQQPMDTDQPAQQNADGAAAAPDSAEKPGKQKGKSSVRWIDLPVDSFIPGTLDQKLVQRYVERENEMMMQDKLRQETTDAKNAVEEFVYEMRNKLQSEYAEFAEPAQGEKLLQMLNDTEQWLYSEEGESAQRSKYTDRLRTMQDASNGIKTRHAEFDLRPRALDKYGHSVQMARKFVDERRKGANPTQHAHITDDEVSQLESQLNQHDQHLQNYLRQHQQLKRMQDAPYTAGEVETRANEFDKLRAKIMNKPVPKVELPKEQPPPPPSKSAAAGQPDVDMQTQQQPGDASQDSMDMA